MWVSQVKRKVGETLEPESQCVKFSRKKYLRIHQVLEPMAGALVTPS